MNKVLTGVSGSLIRETNNRCENGVLLIENTTRVFFETWDASASVEYLFHLMDKVARLSADCGLYIVIWDSCVQFLAAGVFVLRLTS